MEEEPDLRKDEFCVRLRFTGDDLNPEELTRLLGASPTDANRRGDMIFNASGSLDYTALDGTWAIATKRSTSDIEEQLLELFGRLTPDLDIWRSLTTRYEGDLFCGVFLFWFGHGFDMSPALHRALADRNLIITFDIYAEWDRKG